ncbi:MAG: L,D-transpeptidase family protein [Chrysiogenales bacterium]
MALIVSCMICALDILADFKSEQQRQTRVREAYRVCGEKILKNLQSNGLQPHELEIYIRSFKQEMCLEIWGRKLGDSPMVLLATYPICDFSGTIGPKRCQGDGQVPEGFYCIDRFNPWSDFYLSLGINYPNFSDRILKTCQDPGGTIFIHGSCVTIGCIPITDPWIRELYIYCLEAKNSGQKKIPVHIFPSRLDQINYRRLQGTYFQQKEWLGLWEDLKTAYDLFKKKRTPPQIRFLPTGRHKIS